VKKEKQDFTILSLTTFQVKKEKQDFTILSLTTFQVKKEKQDFTILLLATFQVKNKNEKNFGDGDVAKITPISSLTTSPVKN
jgi:hypothetical protein